CSSSNRHSHPFPTRRSSDLRIGVLSTVAIVIVKLLVSLPPPEVAVTEAANVPEAGAGGALRWMFPLRVVPACAFAVAATSGGGRDRKSTRLASSHAWISYVV